MLALQNKGLSASFRNQIHSKLNAMFKDAIEDYKFLISTAVRKAHRAKKSKIERSFWRPSESLYFLDSVREHPCCVAFWIMLWNGFRIGEIFVLKYGNIDLETEVFQIKKKWHTREGIIKK